MSGRWCWCRRVPPDRDVTALDFSAEAIEQARTKCDSSVNLLVADMARPLPFRDESFDAVMSNVALHMFDDAVTRSIFAEIARAVRAGGLFVFHVNTLEDRPLRARWRPVVRELEENFVLEEAGQTMHCLLRGIPPSAPPWLEPGAARARRNR